MSIQNFLSIENQKLLWEIIANDDHIQNYSQEIIQNIYSIFCDNIGSFYEKERNKFTNLIQMNKQFIRLIIQYIKTTFTIPIPIPIPVNHAILNKKELITHDDIENKRKTDFEEKYNLKQSEFANAITLKVPPKPDFSDKMDTPMSEIEIEMKRAIAKRNYDMEIINNQHKIMQQQNQRQNNFIEPNTKPQTQSQSNSSSLNSKLKYIKIDSTNIERDVYKKDVIDLNKHISWGDDTTHEFKDHYANNNSDINNTIIDDNNDNIFNKLKLLEPKKENTDVELKITNLQEDVNEMRKQLSEIQLQLLHFTKIQKENIMQTENNKKEN